MTWIQTDDWQWQRKLGDGEYEMYEAVFHPEAGWFAGGGTFSMSDFTDDDVQYVLDTYGYGTMDNFKTDYGNESEHVLAECLFECSFADFDLECFDTEDEAMAHVKKLMKED